MPLLRSIPRDRKIYGNCGVLSPNGILMFKCDQKKANWYIKKRLAKIISRNPFIIKLSFKPNGLGNHNKRFGLTEMLNICSACGTDEFLTRHHVVPYCYRKYLPDDIKSHNHHDILPLCVKCHEDYEVFANELKYELSIKYKSPIGGITNSDKNLMKYIKLSRALLSGNRIPKRRLNFIKNELRSFLGIGRLSKNRLQDISTMKPFIVKKTHGEIVMEKVENKEDFMRMWREHFLEKMDPKYLPNNWNI